MIVYRPAPAAFPRKILSLITESKLGFRLLFLLVLFGLTALEQLEGQQPSSSGGTDFRSQVERETFSLVNQYRKSSSLPPLVWDAAMAGEARTHSRNMATGEVDFGHDGFRDRVDRLKTVRAGFRGAGENVLMTDNPDQVAKNAVAMWLRSPHHLQNIRGDYNYSGVGVWPGKDGAIFFTQIFMKFEVLSAEAATNTGSSSSTITPWGLLAPFRTRTGP